MDCSEKTTENSAICVFSSTEYGPSVVSVHSIATSLSNIVNIEWEISRRAVSMIFSSHVTAKVVLHSVGWSTKTVIVFVILGGFVRVSSLRTGWGLAFGSYDSILTCILWCGNCMRSCVVSMITMLFLIECQLMKDPNSFFIMTKWSANISNLAVAVANFCSNWPYASCN